MIEQIHGKLKTNLFDKLKKIQFLAQIWPAFPVFEVKDVFR